MKNIGDKNQINNLKIKITVYCDILHVTMQIATAVHVLYKASAKERKMNELIVLQA